MGVHLGWNFLYLVFVMLALFAFYIPILLQRKPPSIAFDIEMGGVGI